MEIEIKQLVLAVKSIANEKNLPEEQVQDIIEQSLAAAYRKDYGDKEQHVEAKLNQNDGTLTVYITKQVVEEVEDPATEITLDEAKKIDSSAEIDGEVVLEDHPKVFGRVAAQTAKQVLLQRLRESEREVVLEEYEDKIGTVINGTVSRVESKVVRVDLGRAQGILPVSEQIRGEYYSVGQRLKVYLKDVERSGRGPQLILSRANTEFIKHLFRSEVPEMENGAVEIKSIAREAGIRTKLAVHSTVPGVDAVGTFVGGHGIRVQAVMGEIGDQEKIDIIPWDEDPATFISNALAPTVVDEVRLDEKEGRAEVIVADDQLSIAIGRQGQNVRLASKLTEWEIDVKSEDKTPAEEAPREAKARKKFASKADLESSLLSTLENGTEADETEASDGNDEAAASSEEE